MFLMRIPHKCCYFLKSDPKFKMVAMSSDWLRHFELLLKMAGFMTSRFGPNVVPPSDIVLCYISCGRRMEDGQFMRFDWLRPSSQERLKAWSPNYVQMFPMRSRTSVVTFWADPKSKMAAMSSDWLRHFELLLKYGWRHEVQTWYKCSSWGPAQVYFLLEPMEYKMAAIALIGWDILNFFSRTAKAWSPNLVQMFLMRSHTSVVTFWRSWV